MTPQLQNAIAAVQALSAAEQLQLFQILSGFLQQSQTLEAQSQTFWTGTLLENLVSTQQPPIVNDLGMLASDSWAEESSNDFLAFLKQQREAESVALE